MWINKVEPTVGYSGCFRSLLAAVTLCLLPGLFWSVGLAQGQPLFQGSLSCPAGVPTGQQVGQGLLSALTDPTKGDALNTAWQQAEPSIEQLPITESRLHVPDGC